MTRDLLVGLLFLGAILIVGVITFMLNGISGGSASYPLSIAFADVGGLQKGDSVRVRGMKFGEIKEVTFAEEKVTVDIVLKNEITPKEGYVFEVLASSPLGGTYLRYAPGEGAPVGLDTLEGKAGGDLFSTINEILAENRENIRESIASLDSILTTIDQGEGVVAALFNEPAMRQDLEASLDNLASITGKIDAGEGALGGLISETKWRDDIGATIEGVRGTVDHIRSGEGAVGSLIYGTEVKSQLERIFERTDRITQNIEDSRGLLGAILNDATLKKYFEDFARGASNLVSEIRNGDGMLAALINDPDTKANFETTLEDLASITGRIRTGPGTMNSLVYDTALYDKASEAAALLRDTTEDAREQAPISTFFGLLFAPF